MNDEKQRRKGAESFRKRAKEELSKLPWAVRTTMGCNHALIHATHEVQLMNQILRRYTRVSWLSCLEAVAA